MYGNTKPTPLQEIIATCLRDVVEQRAKEINHSPSRDFHLLPFARLVELTRDDRQELLPTSEQEITHRDCLAAIKSITVTGEPTRKLTFNDDQWFHLMSAAPTKTR